jgi:hypothetical protein
MQNNVQNLFNINFFCNMCYDIVSTYDTLIVSLP